MPSTTPRQFRFTVEDLALMDRLALLLAPDLEVRVTRTAVLRLALRELADRRLTSLPRLPKKIRRKGD